MGIEFSCGSLWLGSADNSMLIANGLRGFGEFEKSPNEVALLHCNLHSEASFSCSIDHIDLEMLSNSSESTWHTTPITLAYERHIMIQARWYKKARTRKKWLKRYGTKSDTVRVVYDIGDLSYDHDDGSFDFETTYYRSVLRPDQKRRGLKIEY